MSLQPGQFGPACMAFPKEHHRQIHSTNSLERLNKEIKRWADVVGIFPNDDSADSEHIPEEPGHVRRLNGIQRSPRGESQRQSTPLDKT